MTLDSPLSALMLKVEEMTGIPCAGQKLICQANTIEGNAATSANAIDRYGMNRAVNRLSSGSNQANAREQAALDNALSLQQNSRDVAYDSLSPLELVAIKPYPSTKKSCLICLFLDIISNLGIYLCRSPRKKRVE